MKNIFKLLTILSLTTFSLSLFASDSSTVTISGKIDKGLTINLEVGYKTTNTLLPGCGKNDFDFTTGYSRVPKYKTKTFNATVDQNGNYSVEAKLKHKKSGTCGWELNDFTVKVPISPMPAGVTEIYATYNLNSNSGGDYTELEDITFIECEPKVEGDDIWNYCQNDLSTRRGTWDLINFDFDNEEDRDFKINISLKK